jgi:hypothetical protein
MIALLDAMQGSCEQTPSSIAPRATAMAVDV